MNRIFISVESELITKYVEGKLGLIHYCCSLKVAAAFREVKLLDSDV